MSRPSQRSPKGAVLGVLAVVAAVLAVFLFLRRGPDEAGDVSGPTVAPPTLATNTGPLDANPAGVFAALSGRWLRPDGGYVIEIHEVAADGSLRASYFNPNPIHVSRAAAAREGQSVKVGIELRDTGYPGCLYTLVYDPVLDQLQGTYYQAAQGQSYDVRFVRIDGE